MDIASPYARHEIKMLALMKEKRVALDPEHGGDEPIDEADAPSEATTQLGCRDFAPLLTASGITA